MRNMIKFVKRGGILMKNIINLLSKISVGILTLVIVSVANSTSCYYFHQPEEPESVNSFKWIK